MISIKDLEFLYPRGDFRLSVPSFETGTSEKVAVIGPSGSGKTTLLNLIAGIVLPESGRVDVGGEVVNELDDRRRREFRITRIGLVFQDFELLDYLNVLDNILLPYRITPALKLNAKVRRQAEELAGRMGISDKLKRNAGELSQGEKQRTAICRALLPDPSLILADEATGNLDPENKSRILDLLFDCVDDKGATLLAVTHDHELLGRFDRTVDFSEFRDSDGS